MTLQELRQFISDSPNRELFVNQQTALVISRTGINRRFEGVSAFYEYLLNQEDGLKSLEGNQPSEIKSSLTFFTSTKQKVIEFAKSANQANQRQFDSIWVNSIVNHINSHSNSVFLEFDAPITNFLLEIFKSKKHYYQGALGFLTNNISNNSLNDKNFMSGLLLAYEYFFQGETEIEKRRIKEKSSLSKLRNQITKYISEAENHFIKHSSKLSEESKNNLSQLEEYRKLKAEEYEKWFSKTSTDFSAFEENSKGKIDELAKLYRDQLIHEAPADFWKKRATTLRKEGNWWIGGLITSIVVGVAILMVTLNLLSNGTLKEIFEDAASAIKWSVIFITIVSFLAFLIKTLSKLTFSTFHLVRDAEEREQLTFVFLAMQRDKDIDPTERHLIMQSLFSRADTGLLKDEGSPTMPGNIFDKVIAGK